MYLRGLKVAIVIVLVLTIANEGCAKKEKSGKKKKAPSPDPKLKEALEKKNEKDIKAVKVTTNAPMDNETTIKMDEKHEMAQEGTESPLVEKDSAVEDESPKKSVKNFTCQVTGALLSMANSIKELNEDIKAIKDQMFQKCPGFHINETDAEDVDGPMQGLSATDDKTELEDQSDADGTTTTPLPPIPTECDEPFQPVASSCYYFLYYPHDWKTWGDANAYCQSLGGTLAAPYRTQDLRVYLVENFSNVFWVGAKESKMAKNKFEWLNGREMTLEDWKEGQPSRSAAKYCVYLEYFSGYMAMNHYCGEKFSFICEKRVEHEE